MANSNVRVLNNSNQQVKSNYKEINIIVHYHRRKKRNYIYKTKQSHKKDVQSVRSVQTVKPQLSTHEKLSIILYKNKSYKKYKSELNFKPALKCIASNIDSKYRKEKQSTLFLGNKKNKIMKTWKVFRCQFNIKEETYCCSCNSDAMFEVMKSLYDCYKKKNCDNCKCILCGQIPRPITKPAEDRMSAIAKEAEAEEIKVKPEVTEKIKKEARAAGLLTPSICKTLSEKEKIKKSRAKKARPAEQDRDCKVAQAAGIAIPEKADSEELEKIKKEARAAGLLTPSVGKSPSEKYKIRKSRAKKISPDEQERLRCEAKAVGLVLPKKGTLENIEKIKKEARAAGLLTPSVGKTPSEKNRIQICRAKKATPTTKERIRKAAAAACIGTPEKSTPKDIEKLKKKARAAGIITPSQGKTPSEKERIRKSRARKVPTDVQEHLKHEAEAAGIPIIKMAIPDNIEKIKKEARAAGILTPSVGKTRSEKNRIQICRAKKATPTEQERIRKAVAAAGVGIPKKDTPEDIEKLKKKARAAGLITPSQGKTPSEKKCIQKSRARKVSSNEQQRLKREGEAVGIPIPKMALPDATEKLKKEARGAGLLTPLVGKTPSVKNGIQICRAKKATPTEQERIRKAVAAAGLAIHEKGTPEDIEKLKKIARAAGLITPSQGKSPSEKECIRKSRARKVPSGEQQCLKCEAEAAGIPISKTSILDEREKLKKEARAAGILTPSVGKTSSEKDRIQICRAKTATPTEQKRIRKAAADAGIGIPEKSTPEDIEKLEKKARAAGLITPSQGKTPSEKECIQKLRARKVPSDEQQRLKREAEAAGIPIPEMALLDAAEKLKKEARAAGLLTPSVGKTPSEKNGIQICRAKKATPTGARKAGIAEQERMRKVVEASGIVVPKRATIEDLNKFKKEARAAGIITPSQGQTPSQKEKIRLERAKARKSLEKERLRKAMQAAGITVPASPVDKEKLRKEARAAGFITQGKTLSEKDIIWKSCPKKVTPCEKERLKREAEAAGLVKVVPSDKEELMKEARAAGVITPSVGKTPEEKELIRKERAKARRTLEKERLKKAIQAAGITAPLDKLSPHEKEKIKKEARCAGIITPSIGETPSEKEIIRKSRAKKVTPYERVRILDAARNAGIISPTYIPGSGKELTPAEKEKLLKEGREAGIIKIPGTVGRECDFEAANLLKEARKAGIITPSQGKTPSIKEKNKKYRAEKVLETTPSGKVKTKEKSSITSKKDLKFVCGGVKKEIEEVVKTIRCDRACGCEKRKIRFKHSYVKIKVTSPDLSNICPCPDECLPIIKHGVYTDCEGIKVTVGTALVGNMYSTDCSDIKSDKAIDIKSLEFVYSREEFSNVNNVIPSNIKMCDHVCTQPYDDRFEEVDDTVRRQVIEKYIKCQNSLSKIYRRVKSYSDMLVNNYYNSNTEIYESGYGGYVKTPVESYENLGSLSLFSISITNSDNTIDQRSSGSGELWTTSKLPSFLDLLTDNESGNNQFTTSDIYSKSRPIYCVSVDETNGSTVPSYAKSYKKSDTSSSIDNVYCDYRNSTFVNQAYQTEIKSYFKEYDTDDILVFSDCEDDESVLNIVQQILSMKESSGISSIFVMVPASDVSSYCSSTSGEFNIISKQCPRRIARLSSKTRVLHYHTYGDPRPHSKISRKVVEFDDKVLHIRDNIGTDTCDLPCCCKDLVPLKNTLVKPTKDRKKTGSPTKDQKNEDIATSPLASDALLLQPPSCQCKNLHGCPCLPKNGTTDTTEILNKLMNSKIIDQTPHEQKRVYDNMGTSIPSLIDLDSIKPSSCDSKSNGEKPCENNIKELVRRFSKKMKKVVCKPNCKPERTNDQCIQYEDYDDLYDDELEENDDEDIGEIVKDYMQKLKEEISCAIQKTGLVTPQYREAENTDNITVDTTNTKVLCECTPVDENENIELLHLMDYFKEPSEELLPLPIKDTNSNECKEPPVVSKRPCKCETDSEESISGYKGIKIEILAKGSASKGFLAIPCVRRLSRVLFKNSQTD